MEIVLLPVADEHLFYWQKTKRKNILKKISTLIKAIIENPYTGIGKPEPLRHQLAGKWSRRIDSKNRIVYLIENNTLYIYSLKGHYE
ncbi:MAG: Txe/YoeB family addiction module toxin [Saprospiraceae bacterium]